MMELARLFFLTKAVMKIELLTSFQISALIHMNTQKKFQIWFDCFRIILKLKAETGKNCSTWNILGTEWRKTPVKVDRKRQIAFGVQSI